MKKELVSRIVGGLLGGIVICYLITIGIYFAIVTVLMMTVAYVCEWMEHSVKGVLCYFAIFFAIFIIVWLIQFVIWKRRISKINSKITYKN